MKYLILLAALTCSTANAELWPWGPEYEARQIEIGDLVCFGPIIEHDEDSKVFEVIDMDESNGTDVRVKIIRAGLVGVLSLPQWVSIREINKCE